MIRAAGLGWWGVLIREGGRSESVGRRVLEVVIAFDVF